MKWLLYILLFLPSAIWGQTTVNLSPDSTLYALHILGGGIWTPASISNTMEWWYDAMDESTISLSGSDITGFEDKSSNNRDLAVGTNSPSYSVVTNRITFDKTNSENLRNAGTWTISQPHTTVVVYKKTVAKDIAEYMIGSNTATPYGGLIGTSTSGTGVWIMTSGTAWNISANDYSDHIHIAEFNGASSKYYIDDDAALTGGDPSTNVMTGIELGSYNNGAVYIDAEFMEAICYSGILSDSDRELLITYLQDKWSLP